MATQSPQEFDVIVLGTGPGGEGAAMRATKDGKKYTITGNVTAIDTANPTAPSKKSFEIKVTCP